MRKYASWDIETHKILPDDANIMENRPLGITCISLHCTGQEKTRLFYSGSFASGEYEGVPLARKMNHQELVNFVEELYAACVSGFTPLAWNGNFDFQILLEELGGKYSEEIKKMARYSVDPMYHLFCIKGYPLALETAAQGLKVEGKTEGMSGALAPQMWQESEEGRRKVLEYVAQDAVVPLKVVEAIEKKGGISWVSKSGRLQFCPMKPILTVKEAFELPAPDNSWMKEPIPKSEFYTWAFDESDKPMDHRISQLTGIGVEIVRSVLKAQEKLSK
jgi:hypothetical protein